MIVKAKPDYKSRQRANPEHVQTRPDVKQCEPKCCNGAHQRSKEKEVELKNAVNCDAFADQRIDQNCLYQQRNLALRQFCQHNRIDFAEHPQ